MWDASNGRVLRLTVDIISITDVLQVAGGILPAELRLWPVGFQPRVVISPVFGAR